MRTKTGVAALALMALAAACSGGENGSTEPSPPPPPLPPAPKAQLQGPTDVMLDESLTLTLTTENATSCVLSWTSETATTGTWVVRPASIGTLKYIATCPGRSGTTPAKAEVEVLVRTPPSPSAHLASTDAEITIGETLELTLTTENATSCVLSWTSETATTGTWVVRPASIGTLKYIATCPGRSGTTPAKAEVEVLVTPAPVQPVRGTAVPSQGILTANELRVYLVRGSAVDSADVAADGTWIIRPSSAISDSADVIIDRIGNGNRRFHPLIARMSLIQLNRAVNIILVPRQWTIARGKYRATSLPISLESAYTPSLQSAAAGPQGLSFFLRNTTGGRITYTVATWNLANTPFPIAFDRSTPNGPINPADSIGFWGSMKTLQEEIGLSIFRPANFSEITTTRGIRVTHNWTDSTAAGRGAFTVLQNGTILGGWIGVNWIGHFTLQSGFDVQKHEMGHVFGLGHTCAWKTIMYAGCDYATSEGMVFTPTDVAYFEVLYRVDELQRQWSTAIGLPHSHQGERVRILGLPRESFIVNGFAPGTTGSVSMIRFHGDHIH